MVPKTLSVDLLRIDGGTQNRLSINEDVVEDYAEIIAGCNGKWPFAPLDVFHDGTDYYVADGFHRTLGAIRAKRSSVPCEIRKGTAKDARVFGMTANDRHGLRMSRADKRACVEWLLENEQKLTQDEISHKAGVSKRLVQMIVADRKAKKAQIAPFGGQPQAEISAKGKPGGEQRPSSTPAPVSPGPASGEAADSKDLGKCPNCAGTRWTQDEFGATCAKCHHPHGEPSGGADEDRVDIQRSKTVKTVEALMRAFDDLNMLLPKPDHPDAIAQCKFLLTIAREWK